MTISISRIFALIFMLPSWGIPTAYAQDPGMGRGGRGPGGGGGVQQEIKLVDQFDKNGDKRLDVAERSAAREWLVQNGAGGGRMGRGPGGAGGPPGRDGRGGGRGGPGGGGGGGGGRGTLPGTPGALVNVSDVKAVAATVSLYDTGVLRTIFLKFENSDWEDELEAFKETDVEVPATVTVDGKTYTDVGVHFRGASSFMSIPDGNKRSLNLSFDFVNENQALLGYRTLNLLNANGDPTFMRNMLYAHIANQYIPTTRANLARVVINGESWGVYVNSAQFNKDFLRDYHKTTNGARWKVPGSPNGRGGMEYLGDDPAPYKRIYEIKSKDNDKSWADLINLFRVLNETPAEQLAAALNPILDVDGTLKFLALDNALVNSDGYWTRASDYNIYQDTTGRFHVTPHDMNEAMLSGGRGGGGGPPMDGAGGPPPGGAGRMGAGPGGRAGGGPGGRGGGPGGGGPQLDPLIGLDDATKPLRSKLLAVPELREKYLGYVRDIATRWLDWRVIDPLVTRWQSVAAKDVAEDTRKLYSTEAFVIGVRGEAGTLQSFLEQRRAFLLGYRREN